MYLQAMQGLGDTIYSRPFIKAAVARGADIWLKTAWPQLFSDLPQVKCVSPGNIGLRTQHKNINLAASLGLYKQAPRGVRWEHWHYVSRPNMSISAALNHGLPIGEGGDWRLDLPAFQFERRTRMPYIVVRPCTVRSEWRADNRNPLPEYIQRAVEPLIDDYVIVSVADLSPGHEWAVEPVPYADDRFHDGQLSVVELLAMVQNAAAIISPVGWAVPAALAARKPLLCIGGGQGYNNSPQRLVDPRIDTGLIHWALPDNYCQCKTWTHPCNRVISNFDRHIKEWRDANDL